MQISEERRQTMLVMAAFLALVCLFASFLLFAYALHIKVTVDSRMELIETYNSYTLPVLFMVVGIVNLLQSTSNIYILLRMRDPLEREDQLRLLMVVLVGGIILVIFEATSAIVSFVHIGILNDEFKKGIKKAMDEYVVGEELKKEIDGVQMDYECCGDRAYTDWFQHAWIATDLVRVVPGSLKKYTQDGDHYYADDVPFSCCDMRSPRPCIHHHVHDDNLHFAYNHLRETTLYVTGCRHVLMDIYGDILLAVGWVALAIAVIKTCVLLLVRLIQTSLYKAQEEADWEATTEGYIYYEARGGDDEKGSKGGGETEGESTQGESEAGIDEEEDEDNNANFTMDYFESDFTNNASSASTSSSSSDSSDTSDSDSESWEDLTSTDSDDSTSKASAATAVESDRSPCFTTGVTRRYTRSSRPVMGGSPVNLKMDNLKSIFSSDSRIGELPENMQLDPHQMGMMAETDGLEDWQAVGAAGAPHGSYGSEYYPTELNQRWDRDWQAKGDMGLSSQVCNTNCPPPELNQAAFTDDHEFMSNGPLSKLRRRSMAKQEEPHSRVADDTDQGLLSRIKAHLTGTSWRGNGPGLGGLFSSDYKYSRLSGHEPQWEDSQNKNLNAGHFNRKRRNKKNTSNRNGNVKEIERMPAYNQATAIIDETQTAGDSTYSLDQGTFELRCLGDMENNHQSIHNTGFYESGGPRSDRELTDCVSANHCVDVTYNDLDNGPSQGMQRRQSESDTSSTNQEREGNNSHCSLQSHAQASFSFHKQLSESLVSGHYKTPSSNYFECTTDSDVWSKSMTKHIALNGDSESTISSVNESDACIATTKEFPNGQVAHLDEIVSGADFTGTNSLKGVSFCINPGEKKNTLKKSSLGTRCATPYPNQSSSLPKLGTDLSEYDLVPTSIRPNRLNHRDLETSYSSSPSNCLTSTTDLDDEVAEIISGSSNLPSSGSITKSDAQIPTLSSNKRQSLFNALDYGASISNVGVCPIVGLSPLGERLRAVPSSGSSSFFKEFTSKNALPMKESVQTVTTNSTRVADKACLLKHSPNAEAFAVGLEQSPHKVASSPGDRGGRNHIRSCKRRSLSNSVSPLTSSPSVDSDSPCLKLVHGKTGPSPLIKLSEVKSAADKTATELIHRESHYTENNSYDVSISMQSCFLRDKTTILTPQRTEMSHPSQSSRSLAFSKDSSPQLDLPNSTPTAVAHEANGCKQGEEKQPQCIVSSADLERASPPGQKEENCSSYSNLRQTQGKSPIHNGLVSPFY